jgi:hypothetical protein
MMCVYPLGGDNSGRLIPIRVDVDSSDVVILGLDPRISWLRHRIWCGEQRCGGT